MEAADASDGTAVNLDSISLSRFFGEWMRYTLTFVKLLVTDINRRLEYPAHIIQASK
jgi:hypothetical protein